MILVTGGSGFVGSYLLQLLAAKEGGNVRALYHTGKPVFQHPRIIWMQADLLDVYAVDEAMAGIRQVYHCAAQVSFDPSQKEQLLHNNRESTANIVNAALEHGVEKLVYVSSTAALGDNAGGGTITEEAQWDEDAHRSAYGNSKYYAELEVWRGIAEGLPAAMVNPGIILGPGDWQKGSANLMQIVSEEFAWYTAGTTAWVDVRDVAQAMEMLMESKVSGERYILNAGNFSYREIFTAMAKALGVKPPHRPAGKLMTAIVWRASLLKARLQGRTPTITRETARSAQQELRFSAEKFLAAFPGFRFREMEETIGWMAEEFRASK